MVQLDPTKIQVQSNALPIWEQEETFQEQMAAQLRNAPWLILSGVIHAFLALLVILLAPDPDSKEAEAVDDEPILNWILQD